jgi:hypothetical protein
MMLRKNKIFKSDNMYWANFRKLLAWLMVTYISLLLIVLFLFLYNAASWDDISTFLPSVAKQLLTSPVGWFMLLVPYLLFRLVRHLKTIWLNRDRYRFVQHFSTLILIPAILLFSGFKISKWYTQSEQFQYTWDHSFENTKDTIAHRYQVDGKQRGIHLFSRRADNEQIIEDLLRTNAEWISLVPFGWMEDYDSPQVGRRNGDYSHWSGRDSSFMNRINGLKKAGFYIMMKPHIWIGNPTAGKWRSDIQHHSKADWQSWSENYRAFIMHYARMSALLKVDQFCIGTELHQTVKDHPDYWTALITEVRLIYKGPITYAANWNQEIHDITFWDQLDYIGIQAYFPLTQKKTPHTKDLVRGWKKHIKIIESLHEQYDKPILFTEVGYKSTADAGIEPWTWADNFSSIYQKASYETQANCYEAVFKSFWNKEWFAGIHFWEWQARSRRQPEDQRRDDQRKNINFTPQDKPAENIMTKWFARLGNH